MPTKTAIQKRAELRAKLADAMEVREAALQALENNDYDKLVEAYGNAETKVQDLICELETVYPDNAWDF